jgi:hypothetical protein
VGVVVSEPGLGIADGVRGMVPRGLLVVALACVVGIVATLAGWPHEGRRLLLAALIVLLLLPVLTVMAAVITETYRRAWLFAAAALSALALLVYEMIVATRGID